MPRGKQKTRTAIVPVAPNSNSEEIKTLALEEIEEAIRYYRKLEDSWALIEELNEAKKKIRKGKIEEGLDALGEARVVLEVKMGLKDERLDFFIKIIEWFTDVNDAEFNELIEDVKRVIKKIRREK